MKNLSTFFDSFWTFLDFLKTCKNSEKNYENLNEIGVDQGVGNWKLSETGVDPLKLLKFIFLYGMWSKDKCVFGGGGEWKLSPRGVSPRCHYGFSVSENFLH